MSDMRNMERQHGELIALCKQLDEAVKNRLERSAIYKLMEQVVACTMQHFEAEERLMAETGYPEIEAHKAKHRELLERTRKFRKKFDTYGEHAFTDWFNHWPFPHILAHIEHSDHPLEQHLAHKSG